MIHQGVNIVIKHLTLTNPYTKKAIQEFPYDSFEVAKSKVENLNHAQKIWADTPLNKRLELVQSALQYFEKNKDQIAKDISEEMGRPLHQAFGEIRGFFERANHLCEIATETLSDDILNKDGFERRIKHEPLGVIFVISAWNFPLLITVNSVIPALLSGNSVLLKHSSLTPKIGEHFVSAFEKLGEHSPLLSQVIIDHKTTGKIIEELPIQHVIFTGSTSGGKSILSHTSKRFMMPTLELGGKDGAYIHSDANIKETVASVVDGAMFNSGQSCCGIERAYVHEDVYDEFMKEAEKLISTYVLGDPSNNQTSLGPLAQEKAAHFMQEQIDEATSKGAKVILGGKIKTIEGATFYPPTLISNVNHSMSIMKEENFGPILPVMKVSSLEEAADLVNDSDYGLTSAIFTQDVQTANKYASFVEAGTIFMNRCDYLDPALPWTGYKNSGCGSSLSRYGFYHVTKRKAYHFKVKL